MSAVLPDSSIAARGPRLALGLLALAAIVLIALIALPTWLLYQRYDRALTERQDQLERFRRIAATKPDITRQIEAMRAKEPRKFFLRSGASALATAEVQEIVRAMVESSGARPVTMQALPSKDEGRYRQVVAQVQLSANIFALRKLLASVEAHVPYLFIENFAVRSNVPGNFRPSPGAEPEMFVTFEVHGYSLVGTP